jgi:hypothetical protein
MSSSVDTLSGDLLGKNLRIAGYLVLAFAAIFPLVDLAAALVPASFGNATWRFGAVGLLSNAAMGLSLALFLMTVIALVSNQRRMLLVLGGIAILLAVVLLGSAALFTLDALQTRARVNPAMAKRFDFAAAGALVKLFAYTIANLMMARGAFVSARRRAKTTGRARGMVAPLVVSQPAESGKAT